MYTKDKHLPSNAILGAAALFVVPGVLFWWIHGFRFDVIDWLRIGGTAFLVGMAVLARWRPLPPAITCVVVYPVLAGLELFCGAPSGLIALIVLGVTFLLLLTALVSAVAKGTNQ